MKISASSRVADWLTALPPQTKKRGSAPRCAPWPEDRETSRGCRANSRDSAGCVSAASASSTTRSRCWKSTSNTPTPAMWCMKYSANFWPETRMTEAISQTLRPVGFRRRGRQDCNLLCHRHHSPRGRRGGGGLSVPSRRWNVSLRPSGKSKVTELSPFIV